MQNELLYLIPVETQQGDITSYILRFKKPDYRTKFSNENKKHIINPIVLTKLIKKYNPLIGSGVPYVYFSGKDMHELAYNFEKELKNNGWKR